MECLLWEWIFVDFRRIQLWNYVRDGINKVLFIHFPEIIILWGLLIKLVSFYSY